MRDDCVTEFLACFEKGHILQALQAILQSSETSFDALETKNNFLLKYIANYVEATTIASSDENSEFVTYYLPILVTNQFLQLSLRENLLLNQLTTRTVAFLNYESILLKAFSADPLQEFEKSIQVLHPEIASYLRSVRQELILSDQEIQAAIASAPLDYRENFSKQIALSQTWNRFKLHKPLLTQQMMRSSPWHPFYYSYTNTPRLPETQGTPVIFIEAFQSDYEDLRKYVENRPSIFVVDTQVMFIQLLQFANLETIFRDSKHLIYILEFYPNSQIAVQDRRFFGQFFPVFFTSHSLFEEQASLVIDLLHKCVQQSDEELKKETSLGNWLYTVSKRILFKIREHRLGKSRAAAFFLHANEKEWHKSHKGLPPQNVALGPDASDFFGQQLGELAKTRTTRPISKGKKIKLAHVVPQVVEIGHAPSNLLETLLTFYNKERFDITLIVTERMTWHLDEYPFLSRTSDSSRLRAKDLLHGFLNSGIKVYIADSNHTYVETSKMIASLLHQNEIDIAVFHSPDVINSMCAQITDVPVRVMFEHGTQPQYPGFDFVIVSTQEAIKIYEELFKRLNTKAFALPFAVDVRKRWANEPPNRTVIGLPENGFFMTTISHHLDARLGLDMCLAIVEILKRCPNAFYVPIGEVHEFEKFAKFFRDHGVENRVKFLGVNLAPSNLSRALHLYLNEFPFGSCLGILDAMAAGCPVVTMYDEHGPQQARYGGIFFGKERAITSGKRDDYVELACRLIEDKEVYAEWSEHAVKQYEHHINTELYVSDFEKILESILKGDVVNWSNNKNLLR